MTDARTRALLLDLDGTLLDTGSAVRPRVREALHEAVEAGVRVMVVTGRSAISARPVLRDLGLEGPAVVFNGAGIVEPREGKWLEERVLADRTVAAALAFTRRTGYQCVAMRSGEKFATRPRDEVEERTLRGLHGTVLVDPEDLPHENVIRFTWFSRTHRTSAEFAGELDRALAYPTYVTHFPLNVLPDHRGSEVHALDLHPPCKGKAEAVRYVGERWGIPPEQIVAVGDATNDIPMLRAAGLGVAMGTGMAEALEAADRVIGGNDTDAIADLVRELLAPVA